MKGKRHHKAGGGINGSTGGSHEADEDVKDKPEARTNAAKVDSEAEELKKGGRAKRAHGGKTHVGKMAGHAMHHAGRKPRKSGGRTGADGSPFSSARHGTAPKGRKMEMESEG